MKVFAAVSMTLMAIIRTVLDNIQVHRGERAILIHLHSKNFCVK